MAKPMYMNLIWFISFIKTALNPCITTLTGTFTLTLCMRQFHRIKLIPVVLDCKVLFFRICLCSQNRLNLTSNNKWYCHFINSCLSKSLYWILWGLYWSVGSIQHQSIISPHFQQYSIELSATDSAIFGMYHSRFKGCHVSRCTNATGLYCEQWFNSTDRQSVILSFCI